MRRSTHFRGARTAAAAIEFALIGSVMAIFFAGSIEIVNAIRIQSKLNVAAGQLAEFVARQATVVEGTPADKSNSLQDLCYGAALNIVPYNVNAFSAAIGSMSAVSSNSVVMAWESDKSCLKTATQVGATQMIAYANTPGSMFTQYGNPYPGSAAIQGYAAIVVLVTYRYTNVLPYFLSRYLNFTAFALLRPRSNTLVTCTYIPAGQSTPAACPVTD